jgi:hypothetical protein
VNTRKKAIEEILSFIQSKERFLLLTGTYQNEKHVLALSLVLSKYPAPATVLFRANHLRNIEDFLSPVLKLIKGPKSGVPINVHGGYVLYTDTINPLSWSSSPRNIDVAMVYPIDSLDYEAGDDCVQDLIRARNARKIFLVSWTDDIDFGWTNQFNPVRVIFDAEEENPAYHKRMMDALASSPRSKVINEKLPSYASSIPEPFLVKILCRGKCHTARWARLNDPYPGRSALRSASIGTYIATCLVCGYEATDNYNWSR